MLELRKDSSLSSVNSVTGSQMWKRHLRTPDVWDAVLGIYEARP
jgi:hypothetical protein